MKVITDLDNMLEEMSNITAGIVVVPAKPVRLNSQVAAPASIAKKTLPLSTKVMQRPVIVKTNETVIMNPVNKLLGGGLLNPDLPTPPATPCTDYVYSEWSACNDNGDQIRTGTPGPSGCTPPNPLLIISGCTPLSQSLTQPDNSGSGYSDTGYTDTGSTQGQYTSPDASVPASTTETPLSAPQDTPTAKKSLINDSNKHYLYAGAVLLVLLGGYFLLHNPKKTIKK